VDPAETGLVLLAIEAEQDWKYRWRQQLKIVDTAAIRWRVSIDFFIPESAPTASVGGELIRLVPISTLPKGQFPVVNHRDGRAKPVWLPKIEETANCLELALCARASMLLGTKPRQLPKTLQDEFKLITSANMDNLQSNPSALLAAGAVIDAEHWYYPALCERLQVENELRKVRSLEFARRRELRRW
jgi:hypothetical protein